MMGEEVKIYCTNCGAPMKASARCCLKCGGLNYLNESNASMKHIMEQTDVNVSVPATPEGFSVTPASANSVTIYNSPVPMTNNSSISDNSSNAAVSVEKDLSTSFLVCGIINSILFLIVLFFMVLIISSEGLGRDVGIILLISSFFFMFIYGFELIYLESGYPWWTFLVPVYSNMVLADIAMGSLLYGLLTFIPVVGTIFSLVISYQLGEKFGKSGFLTIFFPFIIIPLIGYEGRGYVVGKPIKDSINFYIKNGLFAVMAICFISGLVMCIFIR